MPLINDVLEMISVKTETKLSFIQGDFGEFLLYDYFENLGYDVCLSKTLRTKYKQRMQDWDIIIPDLLMNRNGNKFFIECKTTFSKDKTRNFEISKEYWKSYTRFYNTVYPKTRDRLIAEKDTQVAFIDVYENMAIIWLIDMFSLRKIEEESFNNSYMKETVTFNRNWIQQNAERIAIELNVFSDKISTMYCNDVYAKVRNVKQFSDDELQNL